MAAWVVWLVAAGALGVAELLTLTLACGLLAVAAALTAGIAGAGAPAGVQIGAFAVLAVASLALVRPVARRHQRHAPPLRTGAAALVGSRGTAVTDIAADGTGGQVRLRGEIWSARPYGATGVIPAGAGVDVIEIDGATALVLPSEFS